MTEEFISDSPNVAQEVHDGLPPAHIGHSRQVNLMGPVLTKWDRVSSIIGDEPEPATVFVTSAEWAQIAAEVEKFGKKPNPQNFRRLQIRSLILVNSQAEDQEACDLLNGPDADRVGFAWKRDNLISGRA